MEEVRGNYWDEPSTQLANRKKKKNMMEKVLPILRVPGILHNNRLVILFKSRSP